jgi:predicted kinase
MMEQARASVAEDGGVVLDATFRRAADRAAAREMAQAARADWRLIECRLPPELARARLATRAARQE